MLLHKTETAWSFTSNRTVLAKLTGISPLHGSRPTVLIACDALNARTVTVQEYHYHDRNVFAGNPAKDCFLDH
ncbi:MAG TPA: conjugal transfer protein [Streptococcus sp.]|nr:conjugal transfer protein [Streptococcus sp.]